MSMFICMFIVASSSINKGAGSDRISLLVAALMSVFRMIRVGLLEEASPSLLSWGTSPVIVWLLHSPTSLLLSVVVFSQHAVAILIASVGLSPFAQLLLVLLRLSASDEMLA